MSEWSWYSPYQAVSFQPRPTTRLPALHVRRVVFPIDDNQQPAGDYVFLEPQFYDDLHRLTDERPTEVPEWLIESGAVELPTAPACAACRHCR